MKRRCFDFLLLTCLLFSTATAFAGFGIHFQSGTIEPANLEYRLPAASAGVHAILQFYDVLSAADRENLKNAGVELLAYLPERAYAVGLARSLSAAELNSLGVRAAIPFAPEYKLHPRVLERDFGPWSEYDDGLRMFNVDIFPDISLELAAAMLESANYPVGDHIEISHTLVVAADPSKLTDLAALDFVLFINEMSPPLEDLNATVRTRLHVNEVQAAPYELSGEGVTILVYDGGMVDGSHPDFGTRVTALEAGAVADHPTHVAGTVGGDGTASGGTYRGMAPAATIISGQYNECTPFCFYNSPNDVSPDYILARNTYDIELTTNSMGANVSPNTYPCSWFGDYELTSRILDDMVKDTENRPLLMFWAAGNERGDPGCNVSSYRCMSIPASAKNIMTIGATTSTDALASFSSFGPTDDGRIKPEVVATGVNVNSCAPGGGYQVMSGTSMATPASAGVACLILEQWHIQFPGAPDPLPETIKALYINSANDLGNAGPDFQSGFGLVNAQRAVDQLIAGGMMQSTLGVGQTFEREFTVTSNAPTLDVSLAWTDIPAVGNVTPTLVNDLDLALEAPNGTMYYPWVLNPSSPGSPATTGIDSVNVCEKVHVVSPASGVWTIHVTGDVNMGDNQTFGLASNMSLVTQWTTISGELHPVGQPGFGVAGIVYVDAAGVTAFSNSTDGSYSIVVPRGPTYEIRARAFYHEAITQNVAANAQSVSLDLFLPHIDVPTVVNGTVVDQFDVPVAGATVSVDFPNMVIAIPDMTTDAQGHFQVELPGEEFVFTVANNGITAEQIATIPIAGSFSLELVLSDERIRPVGPDAGGYFCYEQADTGYAPTYSYASIAPAAGGPGTLIGPGTGNDWALTVALPFNARFYGVLTGGLTVSADGWIGFGTVTPGANPYRNTFLPNTVTPNNCVYVFWDDLYPYHATEGGQIAYYYDEPNGRFIVEYYQVSHFDPLANKVTAQFVLYSQAARPTTTGDSEFEIHYERFDYDGPETDQDATLGMENSTGTTGLMVYFDGGSDPFQYPISAPYSLRYTTGPIVGTGAISGQITAIPATDLSGATLRLGALAFAPNADGSFGVGNVPAGQFRLEFEFAGYENIESEQFTIPVGGEAVVNLTSYRLDAPSNLVGEFDPDLFQVHLNWNPPTWAAGLRDDGSRSLDALSNYTLLIGGRQPVTGIADTFVVYTPPSSGVYRFWVIANYDGGISDSSNLVQFIVTDADEAHSLVPTELYLNQNYPNPFNPTTNITFGLPRDSRVRLDVFDITGRTVARLLDENLNAGHHTVAFEASNLGSGVYFYRLNTEESQLIRKMMLLR